MPANGRRHALDRDKIADATFRLAVVAHSVHLTRCLQSKARSIDRSGCRTGTLDCRIYILAHLVHAHNIDNMAGAPGASSHTVAHAVDVDNHTILADGIGTGQKKVAIHRLQGYPSFLVGRCSSITVGEMIVALAHQVQQSRLTYRHRATTTDTTAFRNQFEHLCTEFIDILA